MIGRLLPYHQLILTNAHQCFTATDKHKLVLSDGHVTKQRIACTIVLYAMAKAQLNITLSTDVRCHIVLNMQLCLLGRNLVSIMLPSALLCKRLHVNINQYFIGPNTTSHILNQCFNKAQAVDYRSFSSTHFSHNVVDTITSHYIGYPTSKKTCHSTAYLLPQSRNNTVNHEHIAIRNRHKELLVQPSLHILSPNNSVYHAFRLVDDNYAPDQIMYLLSRGLSLVNVKSCYVKSIFGRNYD